MTALRSIERTSTRILTLTLPSSGMNQLIPLYLSLARNTHFLQVGAATSHAQTYFSAEPSAPFQDARFSHENENQERPGGLVAPPRQRAEARLSKARFPRLNLSV